MLKTHNQFLIFAVALVVSLMITGVFIPGLLSNSGQNGPVLSTNSILDNMKFSSIRTLQNNKLLSQNPSNSVDVNNLNFVEPAPMGIADYGIGNNNVAYSYNTSSFLGIINITSLQTHNSSLNCSNQMGFQLNVNLAFCDGTTEYVYWVQNVISLNTTSSNQLISFIDNIWNMSSSSAGMHKSSISGNGIVANSSGTSFYYSCANSSCPGNSKIITYPTYIKLKVDSITTSNNQPEVKFLYNDGQGWITYDSVIFKFVTQLSSNLGFVVDGHQYEPDGYSFYNAALILGGPGDGSQTTDVSSNVHLQLEFWNGHNFQQIISAYNFGSDTAEGIQNVVSTAEACNSNGTLFASVTSGSGSLKQIYNQSDVSIVNITTGINSGIIKINGTSYSFINSCINLTISTGKYNYQIYNENGILTASGNFTALPGFNKIIPSSLTFKVKFTETSLLLGTEWFVNLSGGQTYSSLNSTISFNLPNGTFYYTISTANKIFVSNITSGSFTIKGISLQIAVSFSEVMYNVKFTETGLPLSAIWYVNISGESPSGEITASTYSISLTNGTYYYAISTLDKTYEVSSTSSLSFNVNGASLTVTVTFSEVKYPVTFSETGLSSGAAWYVNITGGPSSGPITASSYAFSLINGTYYYTIATSDKIFEVSSTSTSSFSFNVNGASSAVTVTFSEVTYSVTFSENGLPYGTIWYVNITGQPSSGAINAGSSFTVSLPNGTYSYSLGTTDKSYSSNTAEFKISGNSEPETAAFTEVYTLTFSETGLPSGVPWYINLSNKMQSGQITTSSYSFSLINGTYNYSISTSDKIYSTLSAYGSFTESSGSPGSISISFSPNKYSVTFEESGLPNGTTWFVNLTNGASSGAITGSSYSFSLVNGSYDFSISIPNGYSASPQKGTINVNGANSSNSIDFSKVNSSNSSGGTSNLVNYEITGGVVAIFAIVGTAFYLIKKK